MTATDASSDWRSIPGYEGIYAINRRGVIRSLERVDARGQRVRGRLMRPRALEHGHLQVVLSRDGVAKHWLVHRLVLLTFVGPAPAGFVACHGDGDPTNNHLANLRWDTQSSNNFDTVRHGTHHQGAKTTCKRNHLLGAPNLVPSALKRGGRACRACAQAYSQARRDGIPFTKDLADERYRQIMTEGDTMNNTPAPELTAAELAEVTRFGIHEEDQEDEQ